MPDAKVAPAILETKTDANRERDLANQEKLVESGWQYMIVWECELRHGRTGGANPDLSWEARP